MSALTLTLIRFGLLVLLWVFVIVGYSVIRHDLFGVRVAPRTAARPRVAQPRPPKPRRGGRGTPARLVVTAGALAGTTIRLGDRPITIGRAGDSTLVIDDDYASTRHAQLFPGPDGDWAVEDLGSTNGTFLDRAKVTGPTPAPVGVPIRIGKTVLELRR